MRAEPKARLGAEAACGANGHRGNQVHHSFCRRGAFPEESEFLQRGDIGGLVRDQIARGGPVAITDPEMTRYFMTIPETTQFILHPATLANGEEIFIVDMGRPVRILDLAR